MDNYDYIFNNTDFDSRKRRVVNFRALCGVKFEYELNYGNSNGEFISRYVKVLSGELVFQAIILEDTLDWISVKLTKLDIAK